MTMLDAKRIDIIRTREDLAKFFEELSADYRNPSLWENNNLQSFLDALAACDLEGYYLNQKRLPPKTPEWKTLAEMLMAATMYE